MELLNETRKEKGEDETETFYKKMKLLSRMISPKNESKTDVIISLL